MKMKKALLLLLAAILALSTSAAAAGKSKVAEDNAENFVTLLIDLAKAYETPASVDSAAIDADLAAIRAVSEADATIADSIAAHWRAVYLDAGYPMYLYQGDDRAEALEQSSLRDSAAHAFVVLGYELENGEMTDELKSRCEAAAAAARTFPSAYLVCSGGATGENNPELHTEAGMMQAYLTEQCGIDPNRIFVDERARTTVDNAVNTYNILREHGIGTYTIVTSAYHQRWSQAVYNAVGAFCLRTYGDAPKIVENFSVEVEPAHDMYRRDDRMAVRQLASILGLPKEISDRIKTAF
ncbi:MAG: YdcF family protein [Clostridia bacterium]|nr:YdcF family protein [Clostridia bacterium]